MKRVLKRMDLTAKSFFALIVPGSCFVGSMLELALASDRTYMKDDPDNEVSMQASALNGGLFPMSNGLSRGWKDGYGGREQARARHVRAR
jgi:benzoyl-CoA-dihydrodiol lyase